MASLYTKNGSVNSEELDRRKEIDDKMTKIQRQGNERIAYLKRIYGQHYDVTKDEKVIRLQKEFKKLEESIPESTDLDVLNFIRHNLIFRMANLKKEQFTEILKSTDGMWSLGTYLLSNKGKAMSARTYLNPTMGKGSFISGWTTLNSYPPACNQESATRYTNITHDPLYIWNKFGTGKRSLIVSAVNYFTPLYRFVNYPSDLSTVPELPPAGTNTIHTYYLGSNMSPPNESEIDLVGNNVNLPALRYNGPLSGSKASWYSSPGAVSICRIMGSQAPGLLKQFYEKIMEWTMPQPVVTPSTPSPPAAAAPTGPTTTVPQATPTVAAANAAAVIDEDIDMTADDDIVMEGGYMIDKLILNTCGF